MSVQNNKLFSVKKTTDYNTFKMLPFQRDVSAEHVFSIKKSIKDNNMLISNPIIVDKNFYVIDGQHRLAAARDLKLPIYYFQLMIDAIENPSAIVSINTQKRWTLTDYIQYYAKLGFEEYIRFLNIMKLYDAPQTVVLYLAKCHGGHSFSDTVRSGKLRFPEDTEDFLEIFMAFNKSAKDYVTRKNLLVLKSQVWAAAHLHCYRMLGASRYSKFLEALKRGLPGLVSFRLVEDYLQYFYTQANKGLKINRFEFLEAE